MEEASERETSLSLGEAAGRVRGALAAARDFVSARPHGAACACLLLLLAANLYTAVQRKSITNDEIVHIPAGYYHLVAGDFHLNNEHPPLVKMWAALPLLFVQPDEPPPPANPHENFMERTWGYHSRFWGANAARFESLSFWPRVMMIPLACALGALIFLYARRHFGERAALLAVALFAFEPTVLGHGRVVHTDLPAALVFLLAFFALDSYRRAPDARRAAWLGLAAGVALITKFSMVVLAPVMAVGAALMLWRAPRLDVTRGRVVAHALLVAGMVLLVVNAAYYFQSPTLDGADVGWMRLKSAPVFDALMSAISALSKIVPTYFLFGIYNVWLHNSEGHAASLLGAHSAAGWWYYFPVAFALKTSLPFLLVSAAALAWSLHRFFVRRDRRFALVLVPLGVYLVVSLTSHINIGVRHFLPAYPFLFIASGALLDRVLKVTRAPRVALALVAAVLAWSAVEAARAYPDYIPYMSQLASRHPRWHYLSDSNVEWGDDVKALAEYLRARGETDVRTAISGGWGTLHFYGVRNHDILSAKGGPLPPTRFVAIGAGYLNGSTVNGGADTDRPTEERRVNYFARYRGRRPEAVFGGSIYLYREDDADSPRPAHAQ
ncbi:MAG TPA: phospholipid carrier-dependent glycosyltransferase [Pyrinomonadaceae bacterium]|nr:phospholipid carrier-dependent glycosyltransferase [Pyrinomonadaceae bacterium]